MLLDRCQLHIQSCKITATLTQAMTLSYYYSFSLDLPVEWKQSLNVSVALCKRYKQIMSLSLEIKCKLLKRGSFILKDMHCQVTNPVYWIHALGGSIAMWGPLTLCIKTSISHVG